MHAPTRPTIKVAITALEANLPSFQLLPGCTNATPFDKWQRVSRRSSALGCPTKDVMYCGPVHENAISFETRMID
jgi:hypothetical protein